MSESANALRDRLASRQTVGSAIRFGIVGAAKTGIDYAAFNLVLILAGTQTALSLIAANGAGYLVSMLAGYAMHAWFTYRVSMRDSSFRSYFAVSLGGLAINSTLILLAEWVFDINTVLEANIAKAVALAIAMLWTFIGYSFIAFPSHLSGRHSSDVSDDDDDLDPHPGDEVSK